MEISILPSLTDAGGSTTTLSATDAYGQMPVMMGS
jgi:hypothetical protein